MNGDIMTPRYSPGGAPSNPAPAPNPAAPAPTPTPATTPAPMKRGRGKGFLKFLTLLLIIALVAGGVYYWQNQKVKDQAKQLADTKSQIDRLNSQNYNYQQQLAA